MAKEKTKKIVKKKITKENEPPKKLSKAGEWLRSGKPAGYIVDMKAILK